MRLLFCIFLLLSINVHGGEWKDCFSRYVHNYKTAEYGGDSQVWSIDSDDSGFVFMAAGISLIVWDGNVWENYTVDNSSIIRDLRYDRQSGRLYCAGDNFLGYWKRDRFGYMNFTSLYKNSDLSRNEIFWRVYPLNNKVYLQTHESLYVFENNSLSRIKDADIGYLFSLNGSLYAQIDGELCKLSQDRIESISSKINDRIVMLSKNNDKFVCVAENSGFMTLDDSGVFRTSESFKEANELLSRMRIFSAIVSVSGDVYVGTVLDGVYVVGVDGKIKDHYGAEQGLAHTTILSLHEGKTGNIYLGADGGLSILEDADGVKYFHPIAQKIGYVYASAAWNNKLYVGTSKGLYCANKDNVDLVDGTQGQIWDLQPHGEELLVIEDKGLYVLDRTGNYRELLADVWCMTKVPGNREYYCASDSKGLVLISEDSDKSLVVRNRLSNYDNPDNSIVFDKYGYIWVDELRGHVRKLSVDLDFSGLSDKRDYPVGIDKDAIIKACKIDGEVVFISGKECYTYSPYLDSIIISNYYTDLFSKFNSEELSVTQVGNQFFNYSGRTIDKMVRTGRNVRIYKNLFSSNDLDHLPRSFRNLICLNDSTIVCGFSEYLGMVTIRDNEYVGLPDVRILNVGYTYKGKEQKLSIEEDCLVFPYGAADLLLRICVFPDESLSYRIDGGEWVMLPEDNRLYISYIESGNHVLDIGCSGNVILTKRFYVSRHFTSSWWFICCVILLLAGLSYAGVKLYRVRLRNLRDKYEQRQKELLEKEYIAYQNEILSLELKERNKKLSIISLNEITVNNMLNDILKHLNHDSDDESRKIKSAKRCVERYIKENNNWKTFEVYFNSIFDGFFDKLREAYPKLTNNDLKICAYVKLGMNTKEIASMMNIEVSSAESARYRLRKNMGLAPSESLTEVLSRF